MEDAVSARQPRGFHQDVAAFILSILLQPGFQSFLVSGAVVCWIPAPGGASKVRRLLRASDRPHRPNRPCYQAERWAHSMRSYAKEG